MSAHLQIARNAVSRYCVNHMLVSGAAIFSLHIPGGGQRWLLLRVPSGPDSLDGAGGNDTIHGFEGDDTLKGGDGDDRLFGYGTGGLVDGGDGDDWILAGNDSI